ncbi:hypothetical protein N7466_007393 [Penicillium verhagenii]|uniref:uncharacterized protein n=1 Tax=Penicillium verhagenii TaxID=1562060 RepID=UPI002545295F|nr:uncharacterized protein N7466_007393 [Penicillium verhagenii]KAJ5928437.1 hypothetical protein N7466_007393 [Penicillium verhagenii]
MGYHQDAQLYSNISVFEAEMRRRTWLFLQVADCMVSCLIGVPRVITGKLGDTEFPRDIIDEDFGPTTVELPPSQSISKRPTSITYMVALRRIMTVYNEMMDTISSKKLIYDETLKLNNDLEVARDHIPPLLRMHALDYNCPKADNDLIIERHMLEITFQRARCILHRQYLLSNRGESMNQDLRRTCAHAAQRIIELQIKLFQEIIPRARQYRRTWFGASMCITDCLTAAMIICFEIINLSQAEKQSHSKKIAGFIELLRSLYNIWKVAPEPSFETSQAADTLAAMFKLVQSGDANITLHSSGPVLSNDQDRQALPGSLSGSADGRVEMQDPLTLGCLQDLLNTDWAFEMFDWVRNTLYVAPCFQHLLIILVLQGLWDHEMQELSGIISNNMSG